MTTNPLHLYRALLRECTYLALPRCRTFMKNYVLHSFRRYLPKYKPAGRTRTGREIGFGRELRLLHSGRKFLSMLRRANEGHTGPLERVLRMTYGRMGPRRYWLLESFVASESSSPEFSPSDSRPVEKYSKEWEPPSRLMALVKSQSVQQAQFENGVPKVKPRFNPPATNRWGKPLPKSRYKNLKHKWYNENLDAVLPPLPETEYNELRDMVTGKRDMPALIPRRAKAQTSEEGKEQEELMKQSSLILDGPKPGLRGKDFRVDQPHKITPRLLRRHLARVVLKRTPLVKAALPDKNKQDLVFFWHDGTSYDILQKEKVTVPLTQRQLDLLFG
ncbi:uncharacterized protein Z518_07648 [Rhinocladiella mackenziei CBS 650.93]|uniref:LYR motif-containing protein Cup1-like N-terminal domain-containing protein n=1 Tax=Rhinocladiella mackenziei CBS 650.93 TaxID=1442369 RepID=A0A0D2J522_9EURO|nr:uncharacterized protein Z518_07648 [Rhinocladiella mackenziei CBS 650.93]KIX04095.1 hypothetical protein Z518_07648 [Rhinocladiella mackenziei CBS 650.93]